MAERIHPPPRPTKGGKTTISIETMDLLYDLLNNQASTVNNKYAQGMYNGMELILSTIENRRPMFKHVDGTEVSTNKKRKAQ